MNILQFATVLVSMPEMKMKMVMAFMKSMSIRWKDSGLYYDLRSWLRPHRGISQEHMPLYLGFFEFVHNTRKRGKALLNALLELILS
jgi:transposase-like protein